MDIRQLFICHKQAFYRAYRDWPEAKKAYAADFLAREYMVDKAGTRAALFGGEAPMEEPRPAAGPWGRAAAPARPDRVSEATIAAVGPWGRATPAGGDDRRDGKRDGKRDGGRR